MFLLQVSVCQQTMAFGSSHLYSIGFCATMSRSEPCYRSRLDDNNIRPIIANCAHCFPAPHNPSYFRADRMRSVSFASSRSNLSFYARLVGTILRTIQTICIGHMHEECNISSPALKRLPTYDEVIAYFAGIITHKDRLPHVSKTEEEV